MILVIQQDISKVVCIVTSRAAALAKYCNDTGKIMIESGAKPKV